MSGRVVITGAGGRLGSALLASPRFADAVGTAHADADLTDPAAAERAVAGADVVVHTVALTDVDGCERDPARAFAVNVATTLNVARALGPAGGLLVYVSTDQVYSGTGPHREDVVSPVNGYGITKYAGELAALAHGRALVVRTNFVGPSRAGARSWSEWIAETVRAGGVVEVHPDAWFSTLHVDDLVELIADCVDARLEGTFNLGSHDGMRKLDFARKLAGEAHVAERADVDPARAARPLDLRLDVSTLEAALGRELPPIERVLERLAAEQEVPGAV